MNDEYSIGNKTVYEVVEASAQIVAATVKVPGNEAPEREGGYLVIKSNKGSPLLIERIGKCPVMNVKKFHFLGLEKGKRLKKTHLALGHVSSHQSRDIKRGKYGLWGGAIIANNSQLIISFSGLKELLDEAVVLVLAIRMHWLSINEVEEIAEISGNTFVKTLYNLSMQKVEY